MIRRSFRRGIALGLVVGTAATAVKTVLDRRSPRPAVPTGPSPDTWERLPGTTPVPVPESAPLSPWVEPREDGTCPETHPIKAKMTSGIYHVPGGFNYPRTKPDRCYIDAAAAEADGLRLSKR